MTRPLIGITRDSDATPGRTDSQYACYRDSVVKSGGEPLEIRYSADLSGIPAILDGVDGVLFSGGDDIDPALYGESWHPKAQALKPTRQAFEFELLRQAEARRLPILGICLGCQLINVHRGGSLIQFLPEHARENPLEHRRLGTQLFRHDVALAPDSLLARTLGKTCINVNTYHKQAVNRLGQQLRATALSPDGIVEAVEDPAMPLLVGVQWHPERISDEPEHAAVFRMLIQASARG